MKWVTIREDEAQDFVVLLQRSSEDEFDWRLCVSGYEEVDHLTKVLFKQTEQEAARKYMEYRKAIRDKGLYAYLPIEIGEDERCSNSECEQYLEEKWWRYCPRCGTKL